MPDREGTVQRSPARTGDTDAPLVAPEAPIARSSATAVAALHPASPPTIVATGVFFSGTAKLQLGGRYGFMIDGGRFRILGPLSPSIVALDRPLAGMTVSTAHGRLLLAIQDNKATELLVFTSVVGASLEKVAEAIGQAVLGAEGT